MAGQQILERELSTFRQRKPELMANSLGKFAVVSGERVLGVWDTYEAALAAGYELVGVDDPFLVRQVEATETVFHIYRGSVVE
jgi:hypothetical protein